MADSLQSTQAVNKALQQQSSIQGGINRSVGGQLGITQQLVSASQGLLNNIQGWASQATGATQSATSAMGGLGAAAQKAWASASGGVTGFTKSLGLALKKIPLIGPAALLAIGVVTDALEGTLEIARATANTLTQLFSSAFSVAKAIISIEGNIIAGLIQMSNEFAGAAAEYMQAIEDLRKVLGDFDQTPAANVIRSMRDMQGELANTGLSVWRVFGNNAKQLIYFTELATQMNALWDAFGTEIADSVETMGAFAKGMGLSGEEMSNMASYALSTGQTLTEVLLDAANYSIRLGETFGLSAKVISRDVGKMINNVAKFGNMTVKQMTESAIYTRKLGLEMDKILGIVDKFDNFEDAANAASQLSQAFGLNIDAFQIMQEQDPAKRIDIVRKAMQQAGKSTENMTRQELALLAAQTGLDEAAARQAFSMENVGLSYDQIGKSGDDAAAAQMTQTEATAKLADAIERLVVQGRTFDSFWQALVEGFADGIVKFGPMRTLMFQIHRALQQVYWGGVKMGRIFATSFPGISEAIQGLSVYFKSFSDLIGPLSDKFGAFVEALGGMDPRRIKAATIGFLLGLKDDVDRFFNTQGAGRSMFLEGMIRAATTLANMMPAVFKLVVDGLRRHIVALPDIIRDLISASSGRMAAIGSGPLATGLGQLVSTAFGALKDIGGMFIDLFSDPAVQAALAESAGLLWTKLVEVSRPVISWAWENIKDLAMDAASAALSWVASMAWSAFLGAIRMAFQAGTELLIGVVSAPFTASLAVVRAIMSPASAASMASDMVAGLAQGLVGVVETVKAPFAAALDGVKAAFGIASPSSVFADIGSAIVAGIGQGLSTAATVVTAPFAGALSQVQRLFGSSPSAAVDSTVTGLQARLASMEEISSRFSALKASFSTDIAAVVSEMVKQANQVDAAMSDIGNVSLSTGLERIGKALGIDNKRFTVENRGLNITVNLNVVMDAKALAVAVTQKNLLDDNKSIQVG